MDGKPLELISIDLLRSLDTTIIASTLSEKDGSFIIRGVGNGNYLLSVSAVGYKRLFTSTVVQDADLRIPVLQLTAASKTLHDIKVSASQSFLEQRADKLIVDVENNPIAAGSTALELLQKVPGVLLVNDRLTIAGKTSLLILIDGRSSAYTDMSQVLRDMPASNIEKIEVVTNPSAKYEATGGAIITSF